MRAGGAVWAAALLAAVAGVWSPLAGAAQRPVEGRPREAGCTATAPERRYDVVAVAVEITLNRYLDHDPAGRMYVLERDVARVRTEEARNVAARTQGVEPGVSIGLGVDAIQPLTLRVRPEECLRIRLRNALPRGEPASVHLHGASVRLHRTMTPALSTQRRSVVAPGGSVTYEWMVPREHPEGTHYFHSHGRTREQTVHGLFGAVVVEPRGSVWLDPASGRPLVTGWSAIVQPQDGAAFREFALYYHEVGPESYQLLARDGTLVPLVDPTTRAYRPGTRAINYRAESFMNRLRLQQQRTGRFDESLSYSSYTFGDPATPVARSYLGDPVKQRIVHAGSEVFHVHHVHGGSIRWHRQPRAENQPRQLELDKHPPLLPRVSERTDSQSIGPSETFDVVPECASGGCQASVGDYLYHCHVAHHYFAGMWGIWRVYNTLQTDGAYTDALGPLAELPDRSGIRRRAVTSAELGPEARTDVQLPPAGAPRGYDASVWDWTRADGVYLGEPEDTTAWPGHKPRGPGARSPLLFDPESGRLAYPFLRPHFGRRPPFAPNHGPAPYLDPLPDEGSPTTPAEPGYNGPQSVCPSGTRRSEFNVRAIPVPIPLNRRINLVDPDGELYVLTEQARAVVEDERLRVPLTIRANAGQDCVDVVLSSTLEDSAANNRFAKVNLHIHFVQFDVQASDGVITGFNYEQSVRPFTVEGERLAGGASAGATSVRLRDASRFQRGAVVGVGMEDDSFETHRIAEVQGTTLVLAEPLARAHRAGAIVSTEFVRHRWYPDAQFGTAYFHDHVSAITSWRHGLFGALVVEPPGSTYHDPRTGEEVRSGPVADIHTSQRVSSDVTGSFREAALFLQDENPLAQVGRSAGGAINLRAEPLARRRGDPAEKFSDATGEPSTPVIEARLGDPIVLRVLVGATNDVHTFHLDGHWFRAEPYSARSPPTQTIHVGISERFDLSVPRAGGPQRMPGDYLYSNGRPSKIEEGSWGVLRVLGPDDQTVRPLPGREPVTPAASACPDDAPRRPFDVEAVAAPPAFRDGPGKRFVLPSGAVDARPLTLHVSVGDCVVVNLTNRTEGPVSLHADMLAYDPSDSGGVAVGREPRQDAAPGAGRKFVFYAHPEVGETVASLRDYADAPRSWRLGLYGAVVVGPRGARYLDPVSGDDLSRSSSWRVNVVPADSVPYRDYTLFVHDEDAGIGTHRMPYSDVVQGASAVSYATSASRPTTPVIDAIAGDPMRVHVLAPSAEQAHVFVLEGHRWPVEPGLAGTSTVGGSHIGGLEAFTLEVSGGAGGDEALPGDYAYDDHRAPYREAGMSGLLRVRCPRAALVRELPGVQTPTRACASRGLLPSVLIAPGTLVVAGAILGGRRIVRRRRRRLAAAEPALGGAAARR